MSTTAKTRIRGAKLVPPAVSGPGVPVPKSEVGVIVTVGVSVNIGKIKVIAGNGASVVVGVSVAVEVGVKVLDGVPEVGDGESVTAGVPEVNGVVVSVGAEDVAVGVWDETLLVEVDEGVCNGAANTGRLPKEASRHAIITRKDMVVNLIIYIHYYYFLG